MFDPLQVAWRRFEEIGRAIVASLPAVMIGLVVFFAFWMVAGTAKNIVRRTMQRTGQTEHAALVFGRLARWVVLVLGLLVSVTIIFPSLDASTLLGTLGIGGVAIGFAFRDIFTNLLSGMILLVTRPFKIGDQIVSGNSEGTVEDIQMRATILRTVDNRRILVPNAELFTGRVTVNTAYTHARAQFDFLVPHDENPQQVLDIINDLIPALDNVMQDPRANAIATELNGDGVMISVRFWVTPPTERVNITHQAIMAVNQALRDAGIDLEVGSTHYFSPKTQLRIADATPDEEEQRSATRRRGTMRFRPSGE